MNQILWGALSATSLGTADFLAGVTARNVGYVTALFWVYIVSCIGLTAYMLFAGLPLTIAANEQWSIILFGVMNTIAMLMLYKALARGPLSVAAPIVAAHPVLVVAFAFILGSRPNPVQWLGIMLATLGAIMIARAVTNNSTSNHFPTVVLAAGACFAYAVLIIAGQHAVSIHGEIHTLWLGRITALATLILFLVVKRTTVTSPGRWWPMLCVQGTLDFGGLLFLFFGSHGEYVEITAVVASLFGAVTVLLARIILKEYMSYFQWCGVVLIFFGVACLSGASVVI